MTTNWRNRTMDDDTPPDTLFEIGDGDSADQGPPIPEGARLALGGDYNHPVFQHEIMMDHGVDDPGPPSNYLPGKPSSQTIGAITSGSALVDQRASLELVAFTPGLTSFIQWSRAGGTGGGIGDFTWTASADEIAPCGSPVVHGHLVTDIASADTINTYDACYGVTIAYGHATVLFPEDGFGVDDLAFKIRIFATAPSPDHPAGITSLSLTAIAGHEADVAHNSVIKQLEAGDRLDLWAVADPDHPTTHRYYLIGFNGDIWARTGSIGWASGFSGFLPVVENGRPGYIGGTIATFSSGDGSFGDSTEWNFTVDSSFDGPALLASLGL